MVAFFVVVFSGRSPLVNEPFTGELIGRAHTWSVTNGQWPKPTRKRSYIFETELLDGLWFGANTAPTVSFHQADDQDGHK